MRFDEFNYDENIGGRSGGLLLEALQTIVFALAVSVVIYLFFAIPNQVDGLSMFPNLRDKEILLTNKFLQITGGTDGVFKSYDYQRGDMVVFQQPGRPDLVKRLIAGPGDKIKIENNKIYVNSKALIEEYLPSTVVTEPGPFLPNGVEKRIPEGNYFVMGDNRTNSKDSRTNDVGFVERRYLKGSPFLRLFPLDRFGQLDRGKYREVE